MERLAHAKKKPARPLPDSVLYAALFAGAAAISAFSLTRGLDPFDEGLALQAARRVADGMLPYQDFQWAYGPGQPYLLAGMWESFGPSLLAWRVLRMLVNAGVAVLVFALARRAAPGWLAVGAWLAAACAMAQPLSANPFAPALLLALAAVLLATRAEGARPLAAGVACGLAAGFRLDFGLYAGAAVLIGLPSWRGRALAALGGLAAGALAYAPFVIAVGPADMWDFLVATALRDREYWTLPFPWSYDGGLSSLEDLKDLLNFYVPLLLAVGGAIAIAACVWRRVRSGAWAHDWMALLVFAAGGWLYLRSRSDEFHETPLRVTLAVLLAWVVAWAIRERLRPLLVAGAAIFALLLADGLSNRLSALFRPPELEPLRLAIADGVDARPQDAAALPEVVHAVQARVPEDGEIYVVTRRSDLVRVNNPLLYVLTNRDNALREDFDLLTAPAEQTAVVRRLRADPPQVVVRWTDPDSAEREPNARGEPSSSRALDEYLASAYRTLATHGYYELLVPR